MNADFAVFCPNDLGLVAAAFPSCGVNLAASESITAGDAWFFTCTAGWDADFYLLGAAAALVNKAKSYFHVGGGGWLAAHWCWCTASWRGGGCAASWLGCTARITAIRLAAFFA